MNTADNFILDAMLYAMEGKDPSKAIQNQEKRGQQDVIRNHMLPILVNAGISDEYRLKGITKDMGYKECRNIANKNKAEFTKQQYERMGIKIIGTIDDLFYSVELPEGWEIKASDNSMWNYLVDDKCRTRASFFYKAAFYDRDAFINFAHRYSYDILPFDNYRSNATYEERKFKPWTVYLTDNGECIIKLKDITPTTDKEYFKVNDILSKTGKDYLDKNFPEWKDINSYWD